MEASLTCAVCLSLFEEPVTLPACSHNFCRHCVAECLKLARSAAEPPPPPPSSSSSSFRALPRSHDRTAETWRASVRASPSGSGGSSSSSSTSSVAVSCPLCRKPCPLPSDTGAASLPVNTTLAEVVKLFRAGRRLQPAKPGREAAPGEEELEKEAAAASWALLAPQLAALGLPCGKHPGRALELYCRICLRGGCAQCVSEEHRGIFHAVNLIDVVYQEEKLAFFSNLKKIRELHLNLMKEVTSPKDTVVVIQNEEEIIKTEFEKVHNALEMRKKQLLEDLESQKKRKEKECLIWTQIKEVHKKTIENVLNDCEKLLDECDPQRFLEAACSLNQRMKTQLDLMQIASKRENQSECSQKQMDTTSVVNSILALNLTVLNLDTDTDIPPRGSVCSISANSGNKWEDKKNKKDAFCPVAGEDILDNGRSIPTQYMSISATAEYRSTSHEEVRYNYYMKHRMHAQTSLNERRTLPKSLSSKSTSVVPFCLGAEAKNQKKQKMKLLQRQSIKGTSLSGSFGFTFKAQAVNLTFSGSSNNLHQLNVNKPQKDSKEILLSKDTNSCLCAVKVPSETHLSLTMFPKVPMSAATAAATLNVCSLGATAEQPTAPLDSGSGGNMTTPKGSALSFKKESVTQDCNMSNINRYNSSDSVASTTTTITDPKPVMPVSENPSFSAFSINSDRSDCFQKTKPSNSDQTSCSFLPVEKTVKENKRLCFCMEKNIGHSCLASSAIVSAKDLVCNSSITSNLASKTFSSAFDQAGASKKQTEPIRLSSNNYSWTSTTPCVFSFKGAMKNNCETTTMKPFSKIQYANDKSKMKPKEKYSAVKKSVPSIKDVTAHQGFKHLGCCSSSSSSIDSCPKSETADMLAPQENLVFDPANSTLVSAELTERTNTFENPVLVVEDQISSVHRAATCFVYSDSDVEDLSQESSASDSSSI